MAKPNFGWILLAQSLSAFGELFGQRAGRAVHKHSNVRLLISTVVYSAIQAFSVLLVLELAFPHLTEGQGALGMWRVLYEHPGLWLNAFNNTVYWMALIYVLREPLGVILVVLAFLVASFFIDPFQQLVGLPKEHALDAGAVVCAVLGTLLCLAQLPLPTARLVASRSFWAALVRTPSAACAKLCAGSSRLSDTQGGSPDSAAMYSALSPPAPPSATDGSLQMATHAAADSKASNKTASSASPELQPMLMEDPTAVADGTGSSPRKPAAAAVHTLGVLVAFAVLAVTAGIGIVITTYFEKRAGLNMFGYAAVDQILLPVTSLPIAWLLYQWPAALRVLGEPTADIAASRGGVSGVGRSFWGVMIQTWQEMRPHIFSTLVPYRGTMFAREFVFFYLATAFSDINSVYLTMTLVRVVLCWLASLLACSYLSDWVGISTEEAATTLHVSNLLLRAMGSGLIVAAIVRLSNSG